jgi:heptosyltransferase-2
VRILVIRFSSLGDVVLATAAVRALSRLYPDAAITFATKTAYAPLLAHYDLPLTVSPYDPSQSLTEYVRGLGRDRFARIIDLHGSWRSRYLCLRLRHDDLARVRKHAWRRHRMVWTKHGLDRPLSVVRAYLDAVSGEGADALTETPRLCLSAEERGESRDLCAEGPILGIGWGARHSAKAVPADVWSRLLKYPGLAGFPRVLLFGLESDRPAIESFIAERRGSQSRAELNAACGLPLRAAMTEIAACTAFVSSDSGLMHVATALGVPTFALFGPTHPALGFVPVGASARAFHAGTWCSPCHRHGRAPCYREQRLCFTELDIDQIASAVAATVSSPSVQA